MQLLALYFYWRSEKYFGVIENAKKLELKGGWANLGPNICLLRQSQTNYLKQNGEI